MYSFGLKTKLTLSNGLINVSSLVKNALLLTLLVKLSGSNPWPGKSIAIAVFVSFSLACQALSIIFDLILVNCVANVDKCSRFVRVVNILLLLLSASILVLDSVSTGLIASLVSFNPN